MSYFSWWCSCGSDGGTHHSLRSVIRAAHRHWNKHHVQGGEEDTYECMLDIGPTIFLSDGDTVALATLLREDGRWIDDE